MFSSLRSSTMPCLAASRRDYLVISSKKKKKKKTQMEKEMEKTSIVFAFFDGLLVDARWMYMFALNRPVSHY